MANAKSDRGVIGAFGPRRPSDEAPNGDPARLPATEHAAFYRAQVARLRALSREELAEDLAAMDADAARRTEMEQLDAEFDSASWTALQAAEHPDVLGRGR